MSLPNPIPSGAQLESNRQARKPANLPTLPPSWTAAALLSPFGDSISPMKNYSQLTVAEIESSFSVEESWARVKLYLTHDRAFFDFFFLNTTRSGEEPRYEWYWLDSTPGGQVNRILGPFKTTLQVPSPRFFVDKQAQWGNAYPLMCTDANPAGIACNHWVVPTPGASDHGSWFSFRQDDGNPFRMFNMDSTNPLMVPVLGSYFIANLASFASQGSSKSAELLTAIRNGSVTSVPGYWNPLVTQEDLHRAMAAPFSSISCTAQDIQRIIPGFVALPPGAVVPNWADRTYIEAWTLGTDFMPYFTRVCYRWTGSAESKQQTAFIGLGTTSGGGTYLQRTDSCLNTNETDQPYFEWDSGANSWSFKKCLDALQGVGLPYPDWVARDHGVVMARIAGNPSFGLRHGETLDLVAAELPRGGGEVAIFWVWFLGTGAGMLFSEGNIMNSLSHNLQLIDYSLFVRDAPISAADFSNPCAPATPNAREMTSTVRGHLTRVG